MAVKINVNSIPDKSIDAVKIKNEVIPSTWSAVKALRDAGTLVPGQFYRITDYQCTVSSSITYATAASNLFDVVVVAIDASHLSEDAKAAHHSGDTYFSSCNLDAWELKYCIDNDTDRFDWADSTNGKGVIYYMKDEFNNEVPYDFKNIMFWRAWNNTTSLWSTISNSSSGVAAYTFSSAGNSATTSFTDYSLLGLTNNVYSNTVKKYVSSNKQALNNNCFFSLNNYENILSLNNYKNTFGGACKNEFGIGNYSNILCDSVKYIIMGEGNCYNTLHSSSSYNYFGINCYYNVLYSTSRYNKFDNAQNNTLSSSCSSNIFRSSKMNTLGANSQKNVFIGSYSNTLGTSCSANTFETNSHDNTLGSNCWSNKFSLECNNNTLGSTCQYNVFGTYCEGNLFGQNCCYNEFGNDCGYNKFASNSGGTAGNYFSYNTFETHAGSNILYNASTSATNMVKNYHFKSSMRNGNISATLNLAYDMTVAKNSSGTVKTYCEADLIA